MAAATDHPPGPPPAGRCCGLVPRGACGRLVADGGRHRAPQCSAWREGRREGWCSRRGGRSRDCTVGGFHARRSFFVIKNKGCILFQFAILAFESQTGIVLCAAISLCCYFMFGLQYS